MTAHVARARDAGVSLVEVLVAMTLFGVLSSLVLGLAISTDAVTSDTRHRTGVAEEARIAMERVTRELRQAESIDAVTLPATPGTGLTAFSFWTDFDGDGHRSNTAADPEELTYCWSPATERLTLSPQPDCTDAKPVLAATVERFDIELDSSEWAYDANGDGITTWQELDAHGSPVGNKNGVADLAELVHIDLLSVTMIVADGEGTQTYHTRIDLRNRS